MRWRHGFVCPACGGTEYTLVTTRHLYQCCRCRHQTSLTAGTIFHASKLALVVWFQAMYHLTQSKTGISSLEWARRLGVTQTTAWRLKHKRLQLMLEREAETPLTGRIEGALKWTMPILAVALRRQARARLPRQDAVHRGSRDHG